MRWEKTTRPFLRTSEFLWQEGHTLHETAEEAQEETMRMLGIYREVAEKDLAIPMVVGRKSESEKFAGAAATYTMEALMHDGQALQSGTSHNLGQHFTKAFDITYLDRNNEQQYPYHTSWGVSTRLIGGLIMVHGDDNGLVLPPHIAPIQVAIIPIAAHKPGVLDAAQDLKKRLEGRFKVTLDDSDNSPGWKFNQWEMKGVPIRVELGPRDLEKNQCVLARRDNGEKVPASLDGIEDTIGDLLETIQQNLYDKALKAREEKTSTAENMDEFKQRLAENPGFIKANWCGDPACEDKIHEETGASCRCIPFDDEQEVIGDGSCVCCGKHADKMAYFARAY